MEQIQGGDGVPNPAGGAAGTSVAANGTIDSEKLIRQEDHRRVLDDMHKYKRTATEAAAQLEALKSQVGDLQNKVLEKDNDWKKIAENAKQEIELWKGKHEKANKAFVKTQKTAVIQAKAAQAGIRPEAMPDLDLLDTPEVSVELTNQGTMVVSGADEFVERLKASRAHWFQTPGAPVVNSGGAGALPNNGQITLQQLMEAEGKPNYADLAAKYQAQKRAPNR